MKNYLLKNLVAVTVIFFTVGVSGAWAEDIEYKINPNNLPLCPSPNNSVTYEHQRTKDWNECWGKIQSKEKQTIDIKEGEWRNGELNGKGKIISSKTQYYGDFQNDEPYGKGVSIWCDIKGCDKYEGDIKKYKLDGIGIFYWSNGDIYRGEWKDDYQHGWGIFNWANGDKYFGQWKTDSRSGEGKFIKKNGVVKIGIWKNDKLIRKEKITISENDINIFTGLESNEIRNQHQLLNKSHGKLEEEKSDRELAKINQRINLNITNTEPNIDGEFFINIRTGTDTASLKINNEEQGGRADGSYTVKKVARAGQATQFIINAKDINGNIDSKTISVTRQITASNQIKYAELNPTLVKTQPNKDAVAIIIGIQNYKRVPKAEYANNDAQVFYDYAIRALGVKPENIKLLVDEQADEVEILSAFQNWLPVKVRKQKTDVYVYYSGHGLPSDDGNSLYILPHGADKQFIAKTAINQQEVIAALQAVQPKSVTMFMDACYSGQIRTGETLIASARPISIKSNAQSFPAEFTVIAASQSDQIASSSADFKHGIFSYYLMKGMEGDADENKDNKITVGEMQNYLQDMVGRKAMSVNRKQVPQITGDVNRVLVGK